MFKNFPALLRIFEAYFVRLSMFHFSAALLPLVLLGGASEGDGVDVYTADLSLIAKVNLLLYFITGILVVLRWKKVLRLVSQEIFFWPFLLVASFSVFWSTMPDTTFRGVVYALGTTLFGIYFASRYTIKEQLDHVTWTLGFIMILSLIFVIALPHYGVMGGIHAGAIRGVYVHKNIFSPMIVLAIVVFFLQATEARENKRIYWGFLALTVAFGILSRSSTALGLMFVMLFICIAYRIFRWRYEFLVSSILLMLILGSGGIVWFVEFGGSDLIFDALGKDATLSSRTEIWAYVWDSIERQPWLGYGLSGFWNGLNGPSAYVERAMRVKVHYAHNGFLDLCLSFGFVGFSLFLANFIVVAGKSLSWLRQTNSVVGFWPLIVLTYLILTNMTEGNIANLTTLTWVLYTSVTFSLTSAARQKVPKFAHSRYDFG